jgi:membrane-associated phospholipid phosphatase
MHPSESAAAAGASAAVLSDFFPLDVATIEGWLADDRTNQQLQWPGEQNEDVAAGEGIGRAVAAAVIVQKNSDNYLGVGSDPGTPPVGPQYWRSSAAPIVRSLHGVRPFFLTSADQLRRDPPFAFGSAEFNEALQEIRTLSDERPLHPEYATIALFYAWQTAPFTAGNLNLIADDVIADHHRNERESARILAYANAAAFDAQIACFDAKFAYWFIRPSQADPLITQPTGLSLPNHPSYPSGHSCITSAMLTTLIDAFPSERERLESLITIIGLSRMYGGLHYRFDVEAGQEIGRRAVALARAGSLE